MLHLRLLGCPTIEDASGGVVPLASRRHPLALLALLAAAPGKALARGKLVGLLWPESPEQAARNRLNTCVHQVRSALGDPVLRSTGDEVQYSDTALRCDLVAFEQALAAGDHARAVALYRGPFLDGFHLAASTEFEQRIEVERERLAQAYLAALEALATAAEAAGQPEAAADWWRRRSAEDRFDARVVQRLMQALDASGNRAEALRVARAHSQRLREEFGAPPDATVEALAAAMSAPPTAVQRSAGRDGGHDNDTPAPYPPHAIAVLPFENMSGSPEADPFAAGLHDDLLTELSRNRALTVIARTSVLRYRGTDRPAQEIARELGVGTLLEGAVQHAGGRLRLNVQLIDARTGGHRWAERYDRVLDTDGLFDIQTELAERIAASLRDELAPADVAAIGHGRKQTASLEAWRLHAQGQQDLLQLTEASVHRAVAFFRRAIACDRGYAPAWSGLADALTTLDDYGYDSRGEVLLAEAEAAARHALSLAPQLAEAHASLGKLRGMRRDGPGAVRGLARAIALRPGYAPAHNWLGWIHQCIGRPALALDNARRAVELDPLSPEAVSNLAICQLANGKPSRALQETDVLRDLAPEWPTSRFYAAMVLHRLGRHAEACDLLDGVVAPWAGNGPRCLQALACIGAGRRAQGQAMLTSLQGEGDHFSVALVHIALENAEAATAAFARVDNWADYWPTLSVHQYFPQLWARCPDAAAHARERVNVAWGLAADGSMQGT